LVQVFVFAPAYLAHVGDLGGCNKFAHTWLVNNMYVSILDLVVYALYLSFISDISETGILTYQHVKDVLLKDSTPAAAIVLIIHSI
jgi:hypothetical protein